MNNNYNGYYNPYMYSRAVPTPNFQSMPNYTRSVPGAVFPGVGAANSSLGAAATGTRGLGGLLSRIFPGLGGAAAASAGTGVASTAGTGITFSGILNGASKTLGVINQAIPVVNQIKPVWNNAKTMLRMAKAMNSSDYEITKKTNTSSTTNSTTTNNISNALKKASNNEPTFFN